MEHDLNDFAADEILALAERIAQRAHDRSQAHALAEALETLRNTMERSATLAPDVANAVRAIVTAGPSAWLEYAVEQRLEQDETEL